MATLAGHTASITAVAFSPDGTRLIMRSVAVLVAFLLLPIFALAQSRLVSPPQVAPAPSEPPSPSVPEGQRPPQEQRSGAQQSSAREQRGTEDNPLIVKTLPADKTTEERAQEKTDHDEKATADWWMRILTGALVGVGLLQLLAFTGQIIVFVRQAQSLRDSVNELRRATAATETTANAARTSADATKRAAETLPQVERAYISGGGEARGRDGQYNFGYFRVDVNNYGKTPGEIIRIRYGRCDTAELGGEREPTWSGTEDWIEWIAPDTRSRPTVFFHIPKSDGHLVVYGRIYYRDIFRRGHSCGLILRIWSDGTTEPIAAPSPAYTKDRDEPEDDA